MYEENINETKNCNDEAIIKLVGRLTLEFDIFEELITQRKLKSILDEALYGYDIRTTCTDLIVSDIEQKMQIYIAVRRLEGLSEKTLSNYQGILIKFAQFFHKPLSSITAMDIRMWLATYKNNGIQESTINSKIFVLNKFFQFLVDEEYLAKNVMHKIKVVKLPKRCKKVMSIEQLEMLKNGCKTIREQLLINFGFSTGCRISEVCNANISDINFEEKSIYIIGKGNKERKVYFDTKTKMLLQQYIKERKTFKEGNALIISDKFPFERMRTRGVQVVLDKIKARVGLDGIDYITYHGLRRACFTYELKHGMKLEQIQRLAGHSSPETTLMYAKMTDGDLKHAYETSM